MKQLDEQHTKDAAAKVFVNAFCKSYWKFHEDRIKRWLLSQYDFNYEEKPLYDMFLDQFSFDSGWEEPSLGLMLHEMLNFLDITGYYVTSPMYQWFEKEYDKLVEEIWSGGN